MMGSRRKLRWDAPKPLHCLHSTMAFVTDLSRHGLYTQSINWSLTKSHPQCPFVACSSLVSSPASSCIMHSNFPWTHVNESFATCQSLSLAMKKCWALWQVQHFSLTVLSESKSWITSITSKNKGSLAKHECRVSSAVDDTGEAVVPTSKRSCMIPHDSSQSSLTFQSLPSPRVCSLVMNMQLRPSAAVFKILGQCLSTMWYARIPSLQRACAMVSLVLRSVSCKAWQSILISIGAPQIISDNWSNAYFNIANSRINGIYFSSVGEVRFDAKAMGWVAVTTLPNGSMVVCFCANTAPKPSWEPSVVTMKDEPSNQGPLRTGSDTSAYFKSMNASV